MTTPLRAVDGSPKIAAPVDFNAGSLASIAASMPPEPSAGGAEFHHQKAPTPTHRISPTIGKTRREDRGVTGFRGFYRRTVAVESDASLEVAEAANGASSKAGGSRKTSST